MEILSSLTTTVMRARIVARMTENCPAAYFQEPAVRAEVDAAARATILAPTWEWDGRVSGEVTNVIACALWLSNRRSDASSALRFLSSRISFSSFPWGVFHDDPRDGLQSAFEDCVVGEGGGPVSVCIPLWAIVPPPPPIVDGNWHNRPVETLPRAAFVLRPGQRLPPAFVAAGVTPAELDAFVAAVNASDVDPGGMISVRCCRRKGSLLAPSIVDQVIWLALVAIIGSLSAASFGAILSLVQASSTWDAYAIVVGSLVGALILGLGCAGCSTRACVRSAEARAASRLGVLVRESQLPAFKALREQGVSAAFIRVAREATCCESCMLRLLCGRVEPPKTWAIELKLGADAVSTGAISVFIPSTPTLPLRDASASATRNAKETTALIPR